MALCGCVEPREPAAGSPAASVARSAADLRWHPLGTWAGSGDRQTESFDVRTGTLKLVWETSNERAPGPSVFRVELYSAISGRPLQTIVDTVGVGVDSTYVADEPRVSYLVIESAEVDWRVRLEEGVR